MNGSRTERGAFGHRHRRKRRHRSARLGIVLGVIFSALVVVALWFFSKPPEWWASRVPGFKELYLPP